MEGCVQASRAEGWSRRGEALLPTGLNFVFLGKQARVTQLQDCSILANRLPAASVPQAVLSLPRRSFVPCTRLLCDHWMEINISEGWKGRVSSLQPVSDWSRTSMSWAWLCYPKAWVLGTAGLPGKSCEGKPGIMSYIMSDPQESWGSALLESSYPGPLLCQEKVQGLTRKLDSKEVKKGPALLLLIPGAGERQCGSQTMSFLIAGAAGAL